MRKLVFVIALLCCSTQAMAADPCASLQGKALGIDGNGFIGVIGPNGINLVNQNNTFTFQTTANFINEPADPVTGQCKDRHIKFTRTRQGVFTQIYDGFIFEKEPSKSAGTFSHNGTVSAGWFAEMKSAAGTSSITPECSDVIGEPCTSGTKSCKWQDANGHWHPGTCTCSAQKWGCS
ncbi:MAG: hypothetical protein ACJ76J_16265 [Thermoanaerobaculia bacterium]